MDDQYLDDKFESFFIDGNNTQSINETLNSCSVTRVADGWEVVAFVINPDEPMFTDSIQFTISDQEIYQIHRSFLDALSQTEHIPTPDDTSVRNVHQVLKYVVNYSDKTGLDFMWLSFEDHQIVRVVDFIENDHGREFSSDKNYLSPGIAFLPFFDALREVINPHLN